MIESIFKIQNPFLRERERERESFLIEIIDTFILPSEHIKCYNVLVGFVSNLGHVVLF